MKNIYVIVTQTHTGVGSAIRKFGKTKYNHAAISFDRDLKKMYAFARLKHKTVLLGQLVQENLYRYSLGKYSYVGTVVFELPVTDEQYRTMENTVGKIYREGDYLYNLFSVLMTPVMGGFSTYKSFSCVEFVLYLLEELGYVFDKPLCRYRPDDLLEILTDKVCYKGNLLEFGGEVKPDPKYFERISFKDCVNSVGVPIRLIYRMIFKRKYRVC